MDVAYQIMQEHIVRNNHMTNALPCINTQQIAAKAISKGQQLLTNALYAVNMKPSMPKTKPNTAPIGGAQCFSNFTWGAKSWNIE